MATSSNGIINGTVSLPVPLRRPASSAASVIHTVSSSTNADADPAERLSDNRYSVGHSPASWAAMNSAGSNRRTPADGVIQVCITFEPSESTIARALKNTPSRVRSVMVYVAAALTDINSQPVASRMRSGSLLLVSYNHRSIPAIPLLSTAAASSSAATSAAPEVFHSADDVDDPTSIPASKANNRVRSTAAASHSSAGLRRM